MAGRLDIFLAAVMALLTFTPAEPLPWDMHSFMKSMTENKITTYFAIQRGSSEMKCQISVRIKKLIPQNVHIPGSPVGLILLI